MDQLESASEQLRSLGLPSVMESEVVIKGLHNIGTRSQETAKSIGLRAVAEGQITRQRLAELLDVTHMTVWRWTKDTEEPNKEPR